VKKKRGEKGQRSDSFLSLSPTNLILFFYLFIIFLDFSMKKAFADTTPRRIYIERETRVVCIGDGV
jgi:hypothetical protein